MRKDSCPGINMMLRVDREMVDTTKATADKFVFLDDIVEAVLPLGTDVVRGGTGRAQKTWTRSSRWLPSTIHRMLQSEVLVQQ